VPFAYHERCLNASSNYAQSKEVSVLFFALFLLIIYSLQIINLLPVYRKKVFLYLCSFLQEVLNHSNQNGLDAKTLGKNSKTPRNKKANAILI